MHKQASLTWSQSVMLCKSLFACHSCWSITRPTRVKVFDPVTNRWAHPIADGLEDW